MSRLYKTVRMLIQPLVRIMFRIRCVGLENIPKDGPFMLCCNHTSVTDVFLLVALCPRQINFMAKKELFKNPILRTVISAFGAFPVDRGGRDISAIRRSCAVIKEGKVLGIFPEGKRYITGPMREVKPGCSFVAIKTGADVLPVSIYKEGKTHPLRRVTVRFGQVVKNADLCDSKATKESISLVSDKIFKHITELWELKF